MNEPVIRSNETYLFTPDYFNATKKALIENPNAGHIHFVVLTYNFNLKLDVPLYERYAKYELGVIVNLNRIRKKALDPDDYTKEVLKDLFKHYKPNLIIH
jgi:hypothetical protein